MHMFSVSSPLRRRAFRLFNGEETEEKNRLLLELYTMYNVQWIM